MLRVILIAKILISDKKAPLFLERGWGEAYAIQLVTPSDVPSAVRILISI